MSRSTPRKKCLPQGILSAAMAALLAFSLGSAGPAQADDLDDRKAALEQEIEEIEHSLEFLNGDIVETVKELKEYQSRLPGAQQKLSEAEGRVDAAANNVAALAQRVDLALQTKDKINQQLASDAEELKETKKVIGQIATQAYKQGGVPSNLSLFFGSDGDASLASTIDLADQALRSQNAALNKLSQQNATNVNSQARLEAVEEEIRGLKAQAEEALAAEQTARDEAAAEKQKVDQLISETSALSDSLQARKPEIEQELAKSEQAQQQVLSQIKERQERLRREAEEKARREAEAQRKAQEAWEREQARIKAAQQAARNNGQPVPQIIPKVKPPKPASSSPSSFGLVAPTSGVITSGFGWRSTPPGTIDFFGTGGYLHSGIDYGPGCDAPVFAPAAGTVERADGSVWGGGNSVTISHGWVAGNVLDTNYYHLNKYVVYAGQRVGQGQLIGYVGSTGNSTGCHLHFETILNAEFVNPLNLL
ncbi:peptidoglycan DD-metalloendopeptidase family protein [Arthrobacter sp.]|uniref:peptidoglycan DD-metalloendopeptidase family protein n=1 Tax=Arthrobacter sp. TaxID=1667 RepID=UPI003390D741